MSPTRRRSTASQTPTAILTWADVSNAMASVPPAAAPLLQSLLGDHEASSPAMGESENDVPWFLSGVEISGHIGIGEYAVSFDLVPAPGLTVIAAPNGTGKTSIVHGMRRCLGNDPSSIDVLPDNLHHKVRNISVFMSGGSRSVTLRCSGSSTASWSEHDATQSFPFSWDRDFQRYQPVLLYPEVARIITDPGNLHAFLESAISVDVLQELQLWITKQRSACSDAARALKDIRDKLDQAVAGVAYAELRELLSAVEVIPSQAQRKRIANMLTGLTAQAHVALPVLPEIEDVEQHQAETSTLVEEFIAHRTGVLADSDELRDALSFLCGDSPVLAQEREEDRCPVCGVVGHSWLEQATGRANTLKRVLAAFDAAKSALHGKLLALTTVVPAPPTVLDSLTDRAEYGESARKLKTNWQQCRTALTNLKAETATIEQVDKAFTHVAQLRLERNALALLLEQARSSQDTQHGMVRNATASWFQEVDRQKDVIAKTQPADQLKTWVDEGIKATRDVLFQPISEGAKAIWTQLNPSSDLGLGGLGITGGTQRQQKVMPELKASGVTVPSTATGVLVLSTGQRNALSLATYLPRSARDESPFHFLVLDDSIQAFDGSRVHYLAIELAELARRFQVVVFTHDERLWHEVSALSVNARRVALRRRSDSPSHVDVIEVTSAGDVLLQELIATLNIYDAGNPAQATEEAITALTLAVCRQALDAEVVQQLEVLGRRCGKDELAIAADLDANELTRKRLDLLQRYCVETSLPALDLSPYESTIDALNQGAHAQAPPGVTQSQRQQWQEDAVQLVHMVAGLSSGSSN